MRDVLIAQAFWLTVILLWGVWFLRRQGRRLEAEAAEREARYEAQHRELIAELQRDRERYEAEAAARQTEWERDQAAWEAEQAALDAEAGRRTAVSR